MDKIQNNEILDIVENYINQQVDGHAKYELEQMPDMSIEEARKLCLDEFTENLLHEFECPVKIAEKFYGKVNQDTIEKAFKNVNLQEYYINAELLAVDKVNAYINSKCKFCQTDTDKVNRLSLLMIANIFNTLGLSKEHFSNYIDCYISYDNTFRQEVEDLWESALNLKKGTICQYCCVNCRPFFDVDEDSIEKAGAKC